MTELYNMKLLINCYRSRMNDLNNAQCAAYGTNNNDQCASDNWRNLISFCKCDWMCVCVKNKNNRHFWNGISHIIKLIVTNYLIKIMLKIFKWTFAFLHRINTHSLILTLTSFYLIIKLVSQIVKYILILYKQKERK